MTPTIGHVPIYEFECQDCGGRFEELVASLGPSPACPECGSEQTVHRLSTVSPPGRLPRGPGVRDSESRRTEKVAARNERLAESARRRARGESPTGGNGPAGGRKKGLK